MKVDAYGTQPLDEALVYAVTSAGTYIPLRVDGLALRVSFSQRGSELIGQPDWHYARYADAAEDLSLAAGNNTLSLTAIPAGDKVVVQMVSAFFNSTTIDRISIQLYDGATDYVLYDNHAPTTGTWYTVTGVFDLTAGDQLQVYVETATLNDDLHIRAWGRQIET